MKKIDLHVHSNASDGRFSPSEIIDLALAEKVFGIALTDHDNVDGLKEAEDCAKGKPLEFVPGIEFSANPGELTPEIHIVGLFLDYKNEELLKLIDKQKDFSVKKTNKTIGRLNELGYEITREEVVLDSKKEIFGRPEIADLLMKKYSYFKEKRQIFDELLGQNGKAFFKNESSSMADIIKAIHSARGLAFLAHPAYITNLEEVVKEFAKFGGDGIEIDYPYTNLDVDKKKLKESLQKIAKKYNLLVSGGTDFHDFKKGEPRIGDFGVSEEEFEKILEYRTKRYS